MRKIAGLVLLGCLSCGDGPPATPPAAQEPAPEDPAGPTPPLLPLAYAEDLRITEIAVLQAVNVPVVLGGAPVAQRNAPVVAGREALLRVYVEPAAGFQARSISAELQLVSGDKAQPPLLITRQVSGPSSDAALDSTFNFSLPGDRLPAGVRYSVTLLDPGRRAERPAQSPARYPAQGEADLGAAAGGERLRVRLLPVRYDADGSGRLPDTSTGQVDVYRLLLLAMYPVAQVEVSVGATLPWTTAVRPDGGGLDQLLQAVLTQRQRDGAPADLYYVGLFSPSGTLAAFCQGSSTCVTGLSAPATNPRDAASRACVGIGFTGTGSALTLAHELGHAHGRRHAPCGSTAGVDPGYPYAKAALGAWGYSLPAGRLIDPVASRDFMSYCSPAWVSDYTYAGIFERVAAVNRSVGLVMAQVLPRRYRLAAYGGGAAAPLGEALTLPEPPRGEPVRVEYLDGGGRPLGEAEAASYAYDHLPGGHLLVPEGPAGAVSVRPGR